MLRPRSLFFIAALCASSQAFAAAPRKALVLLIPEDKGAYGPTARYSEYLESAVTKNPEYALHESSRIMGDSTPNEAIEARKKLQGMVAEAKKAMTGGDLDAAETGLRNAIKEVDAAAAAMDRCGELCDALAHLSSVQLLKGDEAAARDTLKQVIAIDKAWKFEGPAFGQNFQIILKDLRRGVAREGLLGAIAAYTSPPGARVYVDGQFRGYSPVTVEHMPVGKHLVRFERAGAITAGLLLDVPATPDAVAKATLNPTNEYAQLEAMLDKIGGDVEKGEPGPETLRLGTKLKVDRALIGTVRTSDARVVVDCMLVDFASRKRLARLNRTFDGDEFGQLEKEVAKFGNLLMADAEKKVDPKAKKSKDPLDNRTGMEEWDEEKPDGEEGRAPLKRPLGATPDE